MKTITTVLFADIQTGRTAACRCSQLVQTGNGNAALQESAASEPAPYHVAADRCRAVEWILDRRIPSGQ